MSEPIELGFRQRLAASFADELNGRVFEMVYPPDTAGPMAIYRRVPGGGGASPRNRQARIQVTFRDSTYSAVKRLQKEAETLFGSMRGQWLAVEGVDCPVWVYGVDVATGADGYQASTRMRAATTEFLFRYAEAG